MLSAVIVLPDPDSPTRPTVSSFLDLETDVLDDVAQFPVNLKRDRQSSQTQEAVSVGSHRHEGCDRTLHIRWWVSLRQDRSAG